MKRDRTHDKRIERLEVDLANLRTLIAELQRAVVLHVPAARRWWEIWK